MTHPEAEGTYEIWRQGSSLVLRLGPIAEFSCSADRIGYHELVPLTMGQRQWHLYGLVMSAWSEWVSQPVLHAATLELDGAAIGFLGDSGAGKSSLALEFLASGYRAFGDDQLVLDISDGPTTVLPAVPWFKVGPVTARQHAADVESLPCIHSMTKKRRLDLTERQWASEPRPLRALYVLDRRPDVKSVSIEPLVSVQALLALIRFSYVPRTIAASGLAGTRMQHLAKTLNHTAVFTLTYPCGLQWLPALRQAVLRHNERGSHARG